MSPPKKITKTNYDRLSPWYDLFSLNAEKRLVKIAIRQLELHPAEIVLEIGCGTGANLVQMSHETGPSGIIIGLDTSAGMLARARGKIIKSQSDQVICLIQGNAKKLPVGSRKIDAVLLSFTLELFDAAGIAAVIAECRRVLAPAGRICVVGLSRKPGNTFPVRLYDWFHTCFPTWIDCQPICIEQILTIEGYNILSAASLNLFGLPVEIVVASVASYPL